MRAWRRGWLVAPVVATALVALVPSGCGIPQDSDVVVDRAGQGGPVESGGGDAYLPPGPPQGQSQGEFVDAYLQAAAGDLDRAADRVRAFLAPDAREGWRPGSGIIVVRRLEQPSITQKGANANVEVKVEKIGVLTDRGTLEPRESGAATLRFTIGPVGQDRSRLAILGAPPAGMFLDLMDGRALESWYQRTPLYFWSKNGRWLVPDLRWMPKAIGAEQRPDILLGWLLEGPAPWLSQAVSVVPKDVDKFDNAVLEDDDRVAVNLKVSDEKHLAPFITQLRWTLSRDFSGGVRVQVNGKPHEVSGTDAQYRAANLAAQLPTTPELYGVAGGVVHRLVLDVPDVPPGVPGLSAAVNSGVRYAAISRDRSRVALVKRESGGLLRLWVGSRGDNGSPRFTATNLVAGNIGRPVWPAGSDGPGFVVAGGRLQQFRSGGEVVPVTLPGLSGTVTAVAASPDGQRLALVVNGKLWTAAFAGDDQSTPVNVRRVPTALRDLSGVAWLGETDLVISGLAANRVGLRKVSIDGGYEDSIGGEQGSLAVTGLVAYPEQPSAVGGGQIFVEANDSAYQVFSNSITPKLASDVVGNEPDPKAPKPIAPFFLD